MNWRTPGPVWLFCPADRPDRYAKALAAADMVILDLEDAVSAQDKEAARADLRHVIVDPERTIVRVNPAGTADFDRDLAALADTPYRTLMLPKCESAEQPALAGRYAVVALIETPLGVLRAEEIAAAPAVVAAMWGAEDLVAALGGESSRTAGGAYRPVAQHARSRVLLAASAHGRTAVDSVYLDIDDPDGLAADAADAVASGFAVKVAIHPRQVETIRAAYRPTAAELVRARRILAAAGENRGVFRLDGRMVDAPVVRQAERVLAREPDGPEPP